MTRITSKAGDKLRETEKDRPRDQQFERSVKRIRHEDIPGLTCAETNVDSILSEGEST